MEIHEGRRKRMRQRFLKSDLDSFAEHEALELLLYYAIPRKDTNVLAHTLLERYGSLSSVLFAPIDDLKNVVGMGESTAVLIHMIPQLMKKARLGEEKQKVVLDSFESMGQYLVASLSGEKNEAIYQICMDSCGRVLSQKRLSEGSTTSAHLDIRKMVSNALFTFASGVVLAHNHPSGALLPSENDYAVTDRAREALRNIDVQLLDHFIVNNGGFASLMSSGYPFR